MTCNSSIYTADPRDQTGAAGLLNDDTLFLANS